MGIIIFFFLAVGYTVLAGIGMFHRSLALNFAFGAMALVVLYHLFYALRRRTTFALSVIGVIITNLAVQLTGGLVSPIFSVYFLVLPVICYREKARNFWIAGGLLFLIEGFAGFNHHVLPFASLIGLGLAVVVLGLINRQWLEGETYLKRSLQKYEAQDQFFGPADFKEDAIATSIKDIDRHKPMERPLLYYAKLMHNMFEAHTTAVFACHEGSLVLIQGFSRSELFRPNAVLDLQSGIYRQVIAERKSVLIKDFAQNPEELGYYKGELKIASVMIAPVVLHDQVECVFVIDRKQEPFTDEDKTAFDEAAHGIGLILGMIRLYETEKYESKYLQTISDVAEILQKGLNLRSILSDTVKDFKKMMKCDDISIASVDELNNQGIVLESSYIKENTKFSMDDGLVGMVARHKSVILKEDLSHGDFTVLKKGHRQHSNSFVGVPVKQDETTILGVLWLEDHRAKRFSEDDIEPLGILAAQLSLAWQRAMLHSRVEEQTKRDGLTGLYNHRHFQELLEQEMNRHKELVLILFDIDHFKRVNDTYGHQAGDEVLKYLGNLIMPSGISARYGGEEFAIILPGTNLTKSLNVAVHLKDHLKKNDIKFNQIRIKITLSIGIAYYPKDAKTRMDLIEKADRALYNAKETGRDKIVTALSLVKKDLIKKDRVKNGK
jgi:diguanylate cyclase (GGDEF)-like protein